MTTISLAIPAELASQVPDDPIEQRQVLELGIRQWKVRRALDRYSRGEGSLAYAAKQAGISLREIIPLAYAYGLTPRLDSEVTDKPLSFEQASQL